MVKSWEDYVDKVSELFPEISREDVENIIKYGNKRLMVYMTNGFDYAVDYKFPKSSVFFGVKSSCGETFFKKQRRERKDFWLERERERLANKDNT